MAIVNGNIFMDRISGMVGDQMVLRQTSDGRTILGVKPRVNGERTYTPAQLARQEAFSEAIAYGQAMKAEPIYVAKASGTKKSAYNVAMADWLNAPRILEVDLSNWHGAAGEVIRLRAKDDVKVQSVHVRIEDEASSLLEEGLATELGVLWWEYALTSAHSGVTVVTITATDIPGHTGEYSQVRTLSGS